jgi:four helix bundle protein
MATYNHFYEMPVYRTCRAFRIKVTALARNYFPKSEEFQLKAQLLNAARSVTANIAEGFGRFHYQENIQYCRQSRGSLTETMEHMITAFDDNFITKQMLSEINADYKECLAALNGYIRYLKTAKLGSNTK